MTNLLAIAIVAIILQRISCLKVRVLPQIGTSTPSSNYRVLEHCHQSFAYCREKYNISRPNMTRTEGERADLKPPQNISSKKFLDHRCFCDADCHRYGDCCLDELIKMDPSQTLEEFEAEMMVNHIEGLRDWECFTLPMTDTDVYIIASCPANYDNDVIINRCRRQVPRDKYDYTLDFPALSEQTNITYANVYCAICNNDNELYKWNIRILCPLGYPNCTENIRAWRYVPGKKWWQYHVLQNETQNIKYRITSLVNAEYYHKFNARKCRTDVISTCPDGWVGHKEKALCQSYSLIVKAGNTPKLYKNEYCAICNGENAALLRCPYTIREKPPVTTGVQSLALVLDFMGRGSQVGQVGVCGTNDLVCGFGELCDPLHKKCRVYTCGRKYQMDDNGKCILTNTSSSAYHMRFTDLPYLDNDCPKFYVSRDKFNRYFNNSVYIKSIKKLFNTSQYEVVNSTTILVCTSHESYFTWKFSTAQSIVSRVCTAISLVCLGVHVLIHILTPTLLNLPGKNLLCLSIALFTAQLSFEFGVGVTSLYELCICISLISHFGFLAAFFWMNVMAVDVFRTFGTATKTSSPGKGRANWEFCIYSTYSWLVPVIIVSATFVNDLIHWMPGFEPMYGSPLCWFNNRQGLLAFFAMPLAILLIANIVFFSLTVTAICKTTNASKTIRRNASSDSIDRSRMTLYIKLAVIMGLTWILGFIAALANVEVIWYFFILLNCLQGSFIFIAFSCKKNVFRMMRRGKCSDLSSKSQASKSKITSVSQTRLSFHTIITSVSRKLSSFDGQK